MYQLEEDSVKFQIIKKLIAWGHSKDILELGSRLFLIFLDRKKPILRVP